jgi:hypothetical protein
MVSAGIRSVEGANMMTKQSLSKIADVVLVSLLALAATFVSLGPAVPMDARAMNVAAGLEADGS